MNEITVDRPHGINCAVGVAIIMLGTNLSGGTSVKDRTPYPADYSASMDQIHATSITQASPSFDGSPYAALAHWDTLLEDDFAKVMGDCYSELLSSQKYYDNDLDSILYDNLWELYSRD